MNALRNHFSSHLRFALTPLALAAALAPAANAQDYYSEIDSAQEVPPNASAATGSATLTIDTVNNALNYNIVVSGLTSNETAAHIHGAADPGTNAGIKHVLPPGSPKIGTWFYPEADEAAILGGRMYINVHTMNFGSGEVRGQICPTPITYCLCDTASGPPCGNDDADSGCRNSTGQGSNLSFAGLPSIILDTLALTATELPLNQNGIFFLGPNQSLLPFGDGQRCVGGALVRFPVQNAGPTGTITLGPGFAAGLLNAGDTRHFQCWYRDPMGPCGFAFNLSEAFTVTFTP